MANNRIILYYNQGKPVYADEIGKTNKLNPVAIASLEKRRTGFQGDTTRNDPDADPWSPKDKNDNGDGKNKKKFARQELVRKPDGTVGVQYVDAKTGKPINSLKGYQLITADGGVPYWGEEYSPNNRGRDKDKNTDKEPYVNPHDIYTRDPSEKTTNSAQAAQSSVAPSTSATEKATAKSAPTSDVEQGDSLNGDTPDTGFVEGDPQKTGDWTYSNGTNVSRLEGVNLNDKGFVQDNRANYTDKDFNAMAMTLAGEIDSRYTDLSTAEGRAEAFGILSTMENRDLANGSKGITDAIYSPKQYSTWNNEKVANTAKANYAANPELFNSLVQDYVQDPASRQPYTNYYNPSIANPSWGKQMTDVSEIGPHKFGALEEYTNKIKVGVLTDEQKDDAGGGAGGDLEDLATDIVNTNIAANAPDVPAPEAIASDSSFSSGVTAQRDYYDQNLNSFAQGMTEQRGVMPTEVVQKSSFDSNYITPDEGLPTVDVQKSGFDSGYITNTPTDLSLGFGDFVDTDKNANSAIEGFALDRAEGDINKAIGSPNFPGDQDWSVEAGENIASSVPSDLTNDNPTPSNTEVGSVPDATSDVAGPTGESTVGGFVSSDPASTTDSVSIGVTNNPSVSTDNSPSDRDSTESSTDASGGGFSSVGTDGIGDWDGYI